MSNFSKKGNRDGKKGVVMVKIDMDIPASCAKCRFLWDGCKQGKLYPYICHATVPTTLVKLSEIDMRDGMCPLIDLTDDGK